MKTGRTGDLVWVEVPYGLTSRHHTWLVEILGYRGNLDIDLWVIQDGRWDWNRVDKHDHSVRIYFKDHPMVLLFKLRWGGNART